MPGKTSCAAFWQACAAVREERLAVLDTASAPAATHRDQQAGQRRAHQILQQHALPRKSIFGFSIGTPRPHGRRLFRLGTPAARSFARIFLMCLSRQCRPGAVNTKGLRKLLLGKSLPALQRQMPQMAHTPEQVSSSLCPPLRTPGGQVKGHAAAPSGVPGCGSAAADVPPPAPAAPATGRTGQKSSALMPPAHSNTAASSVQALRNRTRGWSFAGSMSRPRKPSSPGIITSSRMQSAQRQSASVRSLPAARFYPFDRPLQVVRISLQSSRLSSTAECCLKILNTLYMGRTPRTADTHGR